MFQFPVFYGQLKPHLCHDNGTIAEKYFIPMNSTVDCEWDCAMETSYVNDFGMLCDQAYLQSVGNGFNFHYLMIIIRNECFLLY